MRDNYKWGYHVEDLEKAVKEARGILIKVAKREGTISYTSLTEQMETISVVPDSHALAHILGEVSAEGDLSGDGMLSVLVVYKNSEDLWPGPGFFNLARKELEYDLPDKPAEEAFWLQQREKVFDRWSNKRRRRGRKRN